MTRLLFLALALEAALVALWLYRAARRWREWEGDRLSDTWTTDAETWASGLRDPRCDYPT